MNTKHVLELIREKTIHICTSTDDTTQVTMAVMIAVDGNVLPSMLDLKGQQKWLHRKEGIFDIPKKPP